LDPSLRIAYIEHIAHLVAKDYASVPADLVALGFVPAGLEEAIKSSDAVEVLTDVYAQFAGGGGAAKIDVAEVLASLKSLADRQGNIFQLPPYFAYIARAFSVLEGIGLTNDPDYAIVKECLPYISQRLLSDTDPRVPWLVDQQG
jgi:predicted unusual protein kinase regulating ubiquinone biosynthesis (AarF/ABC1/UbiB family)